MTSEGDIPVLMDDGGYDIGTTRRSVKGQSDTHATTTEDSADDACHERLVGQQMHATGTRPGPRGEAGEHEDGIDGLQTEAQSENRQSDEGQDSSEHEVGGLHRNARAPIDDGRDTRHASSGDVVGQEEDIPAYAVAHHSDSDHHIITQLISNVLTDFHSEY